MTAAFLAFVFVCVLLQLSGIPRLLFSPLEIIVCGGGKEEEEEERGGGREREPKQA